MRGTPPPWMSGDDVTAKLVCEGPPDDRTCYTVWTSNGHRPRFVLALSGLPIGPRISTRDTGPDPCGPEPAVNIPLAPFDANLDKNMEKAQLHSLNPLWFRNQVKGWGPWDYKRRGAGLRFEDFGNFNYGATGYAAGFSLDFLQRHAGGAQGEPRGVGKKAPLFPTLRMFGGVYPYGDELRDAWMISAGYVYARHRNCELHGN